MVYIDNWVASLNLEYKLLLAVNWLQNFLVNHTDGKVDTNVFQNWVHRSLPPFDMYNALAFTAGSVVFWYIAYKTEYFVINTLFQCFRKSYPSLEHYFKMTPKEKKFYVSYYHGIIHALISGLGAIYCFIYADGRPNTTWFHCNFYKLHMFDVQKYFNCLSAGYLI